MFRAAFTALTLAAFASPAWALERNDLVGEWQTQSANAAGETPGADTPMIVRADTSEDSLDGVTPAPGWDGVMKGEVSVADNGALVWTGRWASIWPEGATMGTFRLVFTDANTFTGTWSTDDGVVSGAAWNGRRAR